MTAAVEVAVVTPAYGNEDTLPELARRLAVALEGRSWRLRVVVDASPDASLAVARGLAAVDARISVTALDRNVGQHRALARGLADEEEDEDTVAAWVCLDADLQDPPEAVPVLLRRLAEGDVGPSSPAVEVRTRAVPVCSPAASTGRSWDGSPACPPTLAPS